MVAVRVGIQMMEDWCKEMVSMSGVVRELREDEVICGMRGG